MDVILTILTIIRCWFLFSLGLFSVLAVAGYFRNRSKSD